jgi:hypothetical protein
LMGKSYNEKVDVYRYMPFLILFYHLILLL